MNNRIGAAIAQWNHLRPPSCRPGSSPKHAFSFIVFVLYLSCEKNENKQKRGRVWPIFLKKNYYVYEIAKIIDTIHEG